MTIIKERNFVTREFTGRYIIEDTDGRILGAARSHKKAADLAQYLRSSRIRNSIRG